MTILQGSRSVLRPWKANGHVEGNLSLPIVADGLHSPTRFAEGELRSPTRFAEGELRSPTRYNDEESLLRYANNYNIAQNLRDRFPFPYTSQDARFWLSIANQQIPTRSFAIERRSNSGEAVGGIGLIQGEDVYRRSAEIGYWLGEPFWGQGLVTEAVNLITDYGFAELGLIRIFAGVFENNTASARVLEKAGYELEGRQRKAVVKQGEIFDCLLYAKTAPT